jgi:DNA-binding beta-propeller fold protein YncE
MSHAYAGSNITGKNGLIAIDKVGNKVRFFDPESLEEISHFDASEPCLHEMAITPDRKLAYAPLYGDGIYGGNKNPNNKIITIDIPGRRLADVMSLGEYEAPHGMVVTSDGKLWVVCDIKSKLLRVDPSRRAIEAVYDTPGKGPHILVMLPDESRLYVSSKQGDVGVFDRREDRFIAQVSVRTPGVESGNGSGSEAILPTADGLRVLALDNIMNNIRVIDTASHAVVDTIPLALYPLPNPKRSFLSKLGFSPDGKWLVATAYQTGLSWIIDARDYRKQSVVPVAKGPQGMAFTADSRRVLVSSHDSGLLTAIDLESKAPVAAYPGGNGIEVLAYY